MSLKARGSGDTKRVVLVNSNQMRPAVAPLSLDYLSQALQAAGFQVDLLDLCFSPAMAQEIEDYFSRNEALAVGVTLRNTDDTSFASQDFFIPRLKQVIDRIKEQTAAPLILGGSGFSIMPEAILNYCEVDLGVWGEGEYSLPLLAAKIAAGEDFRDVPGLVYRSRDGFHQNPPHWLELANIATPKRDTVDNRRYFVEGGMGGFETKRGCSKQCIYCADPLGKGRQIRLRSPDSVADELEALLEQGIDYFHTCDSEFNLPPSHAREVCLKLAERGLGEKLHWYAYLSPEPFSEELAGLMKKAGCVGINFGVDSGCDAMLRNLGRDFTVEDLRQTAEICRRHNIISMYDLLLGGPGETPESLRETIETMKRLSPNRVGASLGVRIFPRTQLAALVLQQGPMKDNPNLQGAVTDNETFFAPVFYVSSALGPDASEYLVELIGGDERFFVMAKGDVDQNYNYNENTVLVNAIKKGYRGAFWDILRRIAEEP